MKVVIDISEEEYELCRKYDGHLGDHKAISYAIKNGTPLPKGHGRLIDADTLYLRWWHKEEMNDLINSPTIIEADKEER